MCRIQRYALTDTFSVRHVKEPSIVCQICHTPKARQVKMVCNFPHLCQFIPVHACNIIDFTFKVNNEKNSYMINNTVNNVLMAYHKN